MKKNRTAIFSISALVVSMLLIVYTVFKMQYFHINKLSNIIFEVILVAIGVFVTSFLHILVHEFGHFLGGKIGGFELVSFRIGFVCIKKRNGKCVLTLEKLRNFGGLCQMLPQGQADALTSFKRYVAGGLVGTVVATVLFGIVAVLPYIFQFNQYVYLLFASGFPISLYLLITNFSVDSAQGAMTDGGYLKALKENSPLGQATIKLTLLQSAFTSGKRPRDVNRTLTEKYPIFADNDLISIVINSNLYSVYLDRKDFDSLKRTTEKLKQLLVYAPDIYYFPVLSDVLYSTLIFGELEEARKIYAEINEFLKKEDDISAIRILAAYELYCEKNFGKAKELCELALSKKNACAMSGIAEMEEEIICEMMKVCEQEKID